MIQTTSGTTISIGPTPATLTAVDFALVAVEQIGEVTDIGTIGKIFNTATHTALDRRQVIEKKTSYNLQHPTLALAIDDVNDGQIAAEAAVDTDLSYTIKVTRQDGAVVYFTAQVKGFTVTWGTDAFENGSIELLSQSDPIKVAA